MEREHEQAGGQVMNDIVADAKAWLADIGGQRLQTHSAKCHKWHSTCLVVKLTREIDRLRNERQWISVSEQLPESGETVLVWHYGDVQIAWLNHFTNGVAYFVRDTHYNFEPTHWMKLPEPPEVT
jgi:hypothetical protein